MNDLILRVLFQLFQRMCENAGESTLMSSVMSVCICLMCFVNAFMNVLSC